MRGYRGELGANGKWLLCTANQLLAQMASSRRNQRPHLAQERFHELLSRVVIIPFEPPVDARTRYLKALRIDPQAKIEHIDDKVGLSFTLE